MKNSMNNKVLILIGAALVCGLGLLAGCAAFEDPEPPSAPTGFEVKAKLPEEMPPDTIIDSIVAGNEQAFEAVQGTKPLSASSVTWSVEGRTTEGSWTVSILRPDTTIGTDGKLRVSPDETAAFLRVRAAYGSSAAYSVEIRRRNANQTVVDLLSDLTEFIGGDDVLVSGEMVTNETNTAIKVPRRKILTIPASATLKIKDGTDHEINGVIIVKGTLQIIAGAKATGLGTIIVESGGTYKDESTANAFEFFVEGPTVVKGGGALQAKDAMWGGTTNNIETFIGSAGIIRLPPDGKLTITENSSTTHTLDYELDGFGVVRGSWVLKAGEELKVKAGTTLSLENAGIVTLTEHASTPTQLILTGNVAATSTVAAKSGARIIGGGKIYVGDPGAGASPVATAISGGTGGWQVVGGTLKEHVITISPGTTATAASIVPAGVTGIKGGAGAAITVPAAATLTIGASGAGLTIDLGGNANAVPAVGGGSIVLKGAGGKLTLADAASKIITGNRLGAGGTAGTITTYATPFAGTGKAYIRRVGTSTAKASGSAATAGDQGYLVEISGGGDVAAGITSSDSVDLSSDLEVWNK